MDALDWSHVVERQMRDQRVQLEQQCQGLPDAPACTQEGHSAGSARGCRRLCGLGALGAQAPDSREPVRCARYGTHAPANGTRCI